MQFGMRQSAALAYLLVILLLGGASAAGFQANLLLQALGAVLIAWTLWSEAPNEGTATGLRTFFIALAVLAALQFLPMPAAVWSKLSGRDVIANGFELARQPAPWLTYSLDPWGSLQSLVWWVPPLALFLAMRANKSPDTRMVVRLIQGFAYISVVLAGMQMLGGTGYLYSITNRGNGVGLFANSNHFGSFMLVSIAVVAGQWLHDRPRGTHRGPGISPNYLLAAQIVPLVMGVALSQSLACAMLLVPLAAGLVLIALPDMKVSWPLVGFGGLLFAIGMVWLLSSGLAANDLMSKSETAGISRGEFLANGIEMARQFAPFGSGIGSFREIYPWYEDAAKIGTTYVNHAHNDLLELVIETGLFGIAVLALFLRWFVAKVWSLWSAARDQNPVALSATLAIGAVMIHSLVDYPLRTAAVSSAIALCCVLAARKPGARGAAVVNGPGAGKREVLMEI